MSNPGPRRLSREFLSTPELEDAVISPETPTSGLPTTPMYPLDLPLIPDERGPVVNLPHAPRIPMSHTAGMKNVDPKTVFVGGLETAWSEEKLRGIFKSYGLIEHIRLVKPCEYFDSSTSRSQRVT